MPSAFDGVTGVLVALTAGVAATVVAALAVTLRSLGSRAAATVLVAAVGLATAGATVATSARASVEHAFGAMPTDLIVYAKNRIDPRTLEAIRGTRSVDLAATGATARATVDGAPVAVAAWDDNGAANLLLARRATAGTIETLASGQVLLSRRMAERFGVRVGDRLTVELPGGDARQLTVAGLFAGTAVDAGVVVSWSDWSAGLAPTDVLVKVEAGTPVAEVQRQIDALLAGQPSVSVRTTDAAAGEAAAPLDRLVLLMWALVAVALGLAAVGITGSAGRLPTVTVAATGAGALFGGVLVWVLGDRGVTELDIPWAQLAGCVLAAAVLGTLSFRVRRRPTSRARITEEDDRGTGRGRHLDVGGRVHHRAQR